ncbi:MAG: rhomboid family intramembrane serine protease [Planctomycetales bacterium]|nr:rhomboid family intramembrane serine protease [Planctomycetales bacterium]
MFLFFPYNTDAPIYHLPIATVALIVINIVLWAGVETGVIPYDASVWELQYGAIDPTQWLLSAFMHIGPFHLLANMFFLWVFGLVVEGKIGSMKFLACYLGIATLEAAIVQILMHFFSPGAVGSTQGASTAIYGIMAMALVWAPRNDVSFWYFVWLIIVFVGSVDIPIVVVCLFYLGVNVLFLALHYFMPFLSPESSLLHLGGFVLGFPLAIIMLKTKMVDCEGWDMFHVWRGDYGGKLTKEKIETKLMQERKHKQEQREESLLKDAHQQLRTYLKSRNGLAALKLLDKLKEGEHQLELSDQELNALVPLLHEAGKWRESAEYMARLIELHSGHEADPVRLRLAQICVVELGRPGRGLDLLHAMDLKRLAPEHLQLARKIAAKAKQQQAEGLVEIDDGAW